MSCHPVSTTERTENRNLSEIDKIYVALASNLILGTVL